jgi:hypothetical protein
VFLDSKASQPDTGVVENLQYRRIFDTKANYEVKVSDDYEVKVSD